MAKYVFRVRQNMFRAGHVSVEAESEKEAAEEAERLCRRDSYLIVWDSDRHALNFDSYAIDLVEPPVESGSESA